MASRHLINNRRWRGQRFGLATLLAAKRHVVSVGNKIARLGKPTREEGASPQWGCDRRTTTWPAQRSAAPLFFSPILSVILSRFFFIFAPLRVFVRWLLVPRYGSLDITLSPVTMRNIADLRP